VNGIHEVMGSIPISSTNSSNELPIKPGARCVGPAAPAWARQCWEDHRRAPL